MKINEKYSYSKYRNDESRPQGSGRVFVGEKVKYAYNPIVHLPAKFWGNIAIIACILIVLWLVFYSPYFRIKEIIVEGNSLVPAEQIQNVGGIGENIFRYNSENAKEKIISAAPIISDVEIYRGIPNALKIVVLERKPKIVWQSGDNFYLLDDNGFIDKKINNDEFADLIHIADHKNMAVSLGRRIVSPEFVKFAAAISERFYDDTNAHVTGYYIEETTFDLYVQSDSGFYVKFDTTRDPEKELTDLKNIIVAYRPNIHEYVDVRINGWAYYK